MNSPIRRPKTASEKMEPVKPVLLDNRTAESIRLADVDLKLGADSHIAGCILEEGCSIELGDGALIYKCSIGAGCHIKLGAGAALTGLILPSNSTVELGKESVLGVLIGTASPNSAGVRADSIAEFTATCKEFIHNMELPVALSCKIGDNSCVGIASRAGGSLVVGNKSRVDLYIGNASCLPSSRQKPLVMDVIVGNTSSVDLHYGSLMPVLVLRLGSNVNIKAFTFMQSDMELSNLQYNIRWFNSSNNIYDVYRTTYIGPCKLAIYAEDFTTISNIGIVQHSREEPATFIMRLAEGSSIVQANARMDSSYQYAVVFPSAPRTGIELEKMAVINLGTLSNSIAFPCPVHIGKGKIFTGPKMWQRVHSWVKIKMKDCVL